MHFNSDLSREICEERYPLCLHTGGFTSGSLRRFESVTDMVDIFRKPGTGGTVGNEEERRKVGEIAVKSLKLEAVITFE